MLVTTMNPVQPQEALSNNPSVKKRIQSNILNFLKMDIHDYDHTTVYNKFIKKFGGNILSILKLQDNFMEYLENALKGNQTSDKFWENLINYLDLVDLEELDEHVANLQFKMEILMRGQISKKLSKELSELTIGYCDQTLIFQNGEYYINDSLSTLRNRYLISNMMAKVTTMDFSRKKKILKDNPYQNTLYNHKTQIAALIYHILSKLKKRYPEKLKDLYCDLDAYDDKGKRIIKVKFNDSRKIIQPHLGLKYGQFKNYLKSFRFQRFHFNEAGWLGELEEIME